MWCKQRLCLAKFPFERPPVSSLHPCCQRIVVARVMTMIYKAVGDRWNVVWLTLSFVIYVKMIAVRSVERDVCAQVDWSLLSV